MKKSSLILAIIFLLTMGFSQTAGAQEKSREEKQREKELQEAIDAQKKAMIEQKKAMHDAQEAVDESKLETEKALKDLQIRVESPEFRDQIMKVYRDRSGTRSWSPAEPFVLTPGFEFYGRGFPGDDSERTSWEFSKSIKETSFDREYIIDVEKSVSNVSMSIVGDCKMGEIRIKIIMPNGKTYSDIVIDEYGNLNWKKSFNVSESENDDKTGPWKFEIKSTKAIGYFKISLQTY
ncbi:MAG: hypothetical protein MUE74_10940 [Bacteroidales bacterium]|jgi:hypothetical protein|nr:hypothetical protein [Bacteroidales bacterium]